MTAALALAALLALAQDKPALDTVTLESGRQWEGIVLYLDDETLVLQRGTKEQRWERAEVARVEGPRMAWREYVDRLKAGFPDGPQASLAMARWCASKGLAREVDHHYWRALSFDAGLEEAHEALGHKPGRTGWRIKTRSKGWVDWDRLLEIRGRFQSGWRLSTTHFDLRAGGSLKEVLDLARDVEVFYAAFYERFQKAAGFFEVTAPMQFDVYPDASSWPPGGTGVAAYYSPQYGFVTSWFDRGRAAALFHEGTHMVLDFTAVRSRRATGALPGWLGEGLAEYMEHCMTGDPGRVRFEDGRREEVRFATVRGARRPYRLSLLLAWEASDFLATTARDLKYAQCYTLVHYLLNAADAGVRAGMDRYLAEAYARNGSMSAFSRALEADLDDVQEAWFSYVGRP